MNETDWDDTEAVVVVHIIYKNKKAKYISFYQFWIIQKVKIKKGTKSYLQNFANILLKEKKFFFIRLYIKFFVFPNCSSVFYF